jgi:hypothetical protein
LKPRGDHHKKDAGKLMWDLLPIESIEAIVRVMTFGARKYRPKGWQEVPDATNRYYAALMRHLCAWRKGETIDPESKMPHLWHALTNLTFMVWFELHKGRTIIDKR